MTLDFSFDPYLRFHNIREELFGIHDTHNDRTCYRPGLEGETPHWCRRRVVSPCGQADIVHDLYHRSNDYPTNA